MRLNQVEREWQQKKMQKHALECPNTVSREIGHDHHLSQAKLKHCKAFFVVITVRAVRVRLSQRELVLFAHLAREPPVTHSRFRGTESRTLLQRDRGS